MKTLKDFNFKGKRVLLRADFNVPLDEKGKIIDDCRIGKTLPTIEYLRKRGAKTIIISHLGKPLDVKNKKERIKKFTLKPAAKRLEELLKKKVIFLDDCLGKKTEKRIGEMKNGEIVLLQNLRFYPAEEKNDPKFAEKLAKLGEIFIQDGFAVCHREQASVVGLPRYLPSAAGLLLEKELKVFSRVLENPWHPLIVIIGGVKISSKMGVIHQFLKRADHLLMGGQIANALLQAKGLSFGKPLIQESEMLKIIEKIDLTDSKIHLPVDGFISLEDGKEGFLRIGAVGKIRKEEGVFDIGPETIKIFSEIIKKAKMIFWSGPLGLFEQKRFENGTKEIAGSVLRNHSAFKIAGGGDTIAALNKFGLLAKFDHISTGGGAMLEFLSGEKLPGIESLK